MLSLVYFYLNQWKVCGYYPTVWPIKNTISILHASVQVQFISCLYCYKCWTRSKVDEMGWSPDTIYSAGSDMSPCLSNGFLHFTQLFPLQEILSLKSADALTKKPTAHEFCALMKYLWKEIQLVSLNNNCCTMLNVLNQFVFKRGGTATYSTHSMARHCVLVAQNLCQRKVINKTKL